MVDLQAFKSLLTATYSFSSSSSTTSAPLNDAILDDISILATTNLLPYDEFLKQVAQKYGFTSNVLMTHHKILQ